MKPSSIHRIARSAIGARNYTSPPSTTTFCCKIPHRSLLAVTGPQAHPFLNGLVTTPIPPNPERLFRNGFYSAFLTPQGRVLYDVFFHKHPTEEGFLIDYDNRESFNPPLADILKRYVLRSKVRIREVGEEWDLWSYLGSDIPSEKPSSWRWAGKSGAVEPVWDEELLEDVEETELAILDRRAPGMGQRVLRRKNDEPTHRELTSSAVYLRNRLRRGVPEGRDDVEGLFPMDLNMDIMGGVDFRKGCYVGQELTVRTYHTGVIRKRMFPVELYRMEIGHPPVVPPDDPLDNMLPLHISHPFPTIYPPLTITSTRPRSESGQRPKPRGTGKLLSNKDGYGLALLRLDQVVAVHKGEIELEVQMDTPEGSYKLGVMPRIPKWWPTPPEESEDIPIEVLDVAAALFKIS